MTQPDDLNSLVKHMAVAIRNGEPLPKMPSGLTLEEAYDIQKTLVAAIAGDRVAGRKAGMTAQSAQRQFGVTHPLLGTLYAGGRMAPGVSFSSAPGVLLECEIGVVIGTDGEPRTAGPVIEVPRLALTDAADVSGIDLVACSIGADRFIAGEQSPMLDSYDGIRVTLTRNGETLSSAPATEALGGPREAVAWMLNESRARGFPVAAGMLFITGACGGIHPARPGTYRADYGELGSIGFTVT